MEYRNENDKTGRAAKNGKEAELLFAQRFLDKFGVAPIRTNEYRDRVEHVDYDACIKDEHGEVHTGSWDVKSLKPKTEDPNNKWTWVEFVTYGHLGWLYGKADWIAFLMPCNKFLCVNRRQLLALCQSKCHPPFVSDKSKAPYHYYVRWHEKNGKWSQDVVSMIYTRELFYLEHWKL